MQLSSAMPALAEAIDTSLRIDLTPILQAVIALLAALVTYKLIPWIKARTSAA